MRAQDVGWTDNKIVLGKHSGRNALKTRLQDLNISLNSEEELNEAFARFKDLADRKHDIFDEDLMILMMDTRASHIAEVYELVSSWVCSETGETPNASVTLKAKGEEQTATATGGGPVDAVFKCIEAIVGESANLTLYSVNNITSGTDAQGEVTVRLEKAGRIIHGHGADTDIVIASAKAYVDAWNRLVSQNQREHPQHHQGV